MCVCVDLLRNEPAPPDGPDPSQDEPEVKYVYVSMFASTSTVYEGVCMKACVRARQLRMNMCMSVCVCVYLLEMRPP